MEVIAKRTKYFLRIGSLYLTLGIMLAVGFAIAFSYVLRTSGVSLVLVPLCLMLAMALVALGSGIRQMVIYFRTPHIMLRYEKGIFYLADGSTVWIGAVTNVLYRLAKGQSDPHSYGTLTMSFSGRRVIFSNVADVAVAYRRIMFLLAQEKKG